MSLIKEQKQVVVEDIVKKMKSSQGLVIAGYKGLNSQQTTELRAESRKVGVVLKVAKNTLTIRAARELGLTDLEQHLVDSSMLAFCDTDALAPIKLLHSFGKKNPDLKMKVGLIEGSVLSAQELSSLADLPSREGLLSMLLSVLQAPMRQMALVVKAVAEQKEVG